MKRFFPILAVALLFMAGCEKDVTNGSVEIKFSGNVAQIQTRVSGTDGTIWNSNDAVGIYMIKADPGTFSAANILADNKQHTASGGATAKFTPADGMHLFYPNNSSDVKFAAYYPYSSSVTDFKLPIDVSNQSNLSAIDVLYSPVTTDGYNRTTNSPVQLKFAHSLSKLVFKISNNATITEPVANGITAAVSNQKTSGELDLTNGTITASGTATTVVSDGRAVVVAEGIAMVEMIVLPSASTANMNFTFVNNAGQIFTVTIPNSSWEGGCRYTYNIKLGNEKAEIDSDIEPWDDDNSYDADGDIDENNYDIVVKFALTVATRAVEAPVAPFNVLTNDGGISKLANAEVFLINASGKVVMQKSFDAADIADGYKRIEQVDASVNKVIAIANVPAYDLAAVKALSTYGDIMAYRFTGASQNPGLEGAGIEGLTLMGESTTALVFDTDVYKEATIVLSALTARFEIGTVVPGNGLKSIELVGVWINNVYTNSQKDQLIYNGAFDAAWTTTPSAGTDFSDYGDLSNIDLAYNEYPYYFNKGSEEVNEGADSKVYAFNIFSVDNDKYEQLPHIVLLVKGEYGMDDPDNPGTKIGSGLFFLQWVTFRNYFFMNAPYTLDKFMPNVIYRVGLGGTTGDQNGIIIDADLLRPTPEMDDFDLGICVTTIAPWWVQMVYPSL